ncbi:unnamed protein product [Mycena citricolor]|uniref:Zinc-finger domain-containing protein n=1 Tax=Mycena citricolor TaxID=2018698 RepID=A0AAD2Q6G7_9AGAR|nr:unnamed protein product [Mycena citricolor]
MDCRHCVPGIAGVVSVGHERSSKRNFRDVSAYVCKLWVWITCGALLWTLTVCGRPQAALYVALNDAPNMNVSVYRDVWRPYIEIPPSPYRIPRASPQNHTTVKENDHSAMSYSTFDSGVSSSSTLKRKLPSEFPMQQLPAPAAFLKKARLEPVLPSVTPPAEVIKAHTYCHQCSKKRDKDDCAHCNHIKVDMIANDKPFKTRRCHNKYCRSCLKNRYDEDLDAIKSRLAPDEYESSRMGEGYNYTCPRCRDACNCSRCRKAKGLEATGKLANPANAANGTRTHSQGKASKLQGSSRTTAKTIGAVPTLKWTKLRMELSVEEAESRMHIREFVLRFFSKSMTKSHLEELDCIGGNGRARYEDGELVPWISEPCLKSVLIAFLSVLHEEETNAAIKRTIHVAIKDLKGAGVGLGKMWQILSSTRDALDASEPGSDDGNESDESETVPSFPDPMPLPDSAISNSRRTRSTGSFIVDTVQMIPVVLGLIDAVLETSVIRTELDNGAKESKDVSRDVKDAIRHANDLWDKSRKDTDNVQGGEFKAKRDAHRQLLLDIEGAGKVVMHRSNPRFAPLGSDRDGRVYYALSPNVTDSESAQEFIGLMSADDDDAARNAKSRRKKRPKREEERSALREWSWLVAIYGKKPPIQPGLLPFKPLAEDSQDNDDSDDDETTNKWWAIWQPAEVRKLATWLTITYRLGDDSISSPSTSTASSPSSDSSFNDRPIRMSPHASRSELLSLVSQLQDYAMSLDFRLREGDLVPALNTESDPKG